MLTVHTLREVELLLTEMTYTLPLLALEMQVTRDLLVKQGQLVQLVKLVQQVQQVQVKLVLLVQLEQLV
jgi:hypothetical protein